jgi:hypothetical protein
MRRNPVKVFLDSNVIISGLFSDKGSPRLILDVLCLGLPFIRGVTGRYNLIEVERNLVTVHGQVSVFPAVSGKTCKRIRIWKSFRSLHGRNREFLLTHSAQFRKVNM